MKPVVAAAHTGLAAKPESRGSDRDSEGSEGEHEESHKETHSEAAIKAQWGILFVTIIIVLSIAFEKGTDYIREATPEELREVRTSALLRASIVAACASPPIFSRKYRAPDRRPLKQVVTALLEELTTLGFLGFAFFLATCRFGGHPSIVTQASLLSLHEPDALQASFLLPPVPPPPLLYFR
jgi:hypothetical protein